MVQLLLNSRFGVLLLLVPAVLLARPHNKPAAGAATAGPALEMDGGRRLVFERNFNSSREVAAKRGFLTKLVDLVAGEGDARFLVRPYSVASDSHQRIIVSDPGAYGVHIFDFAQQKYKFLSRRDTKEELIAPQGVAVDQQDNIYVTDSDTGKIFVFAASGKFERVIGSLRGGEGIFKRPTGIAVDSAAGRIYVSDTWRHKVFVMDMEGSTVQTIGRFGEADGEFNMPTELRLWGQDLVVVDALNFRVQVFDRAGSFKFAIGHAGDGGHFFRPKGVDIDPEGHLYVADGLYNVVQVFDRAGSLLYYFGQPAGVGDFVLPAGLSIDPQGRILVVDSYRRRVQMFQYYGAASPGAGDAQ